MTSSNQPRHSLPTAALIAAASVIALALVAWFAAKLWAPAGVLVVVGAFMLCGLTRRRQQRTPHLPRPAEAPLPVYREPSQLAA